MQKRWSKAEIAHLKRHAKSDSLDELADKLHTDVETVRRKLADLGLTTQGEPQDAEALEHYSKSLELLFAKKYSQAAELLEKAVAAADDRQLADRARQSLEICRRHLAKETDDGDPYLKAVYEKNRGNLETALEICRSAGKEDEDERFAYLLASLLSLSGESDRALEHLETAIRLEPRNRVHAYHDPDFEELRGQDEFKSLVPGAPAS